MVISVSYQEHSGLLKHLPNGTDPEGHLSTEGGGDLRVEGECVCAGEGGEGGLVMRKHCQPVRRVVGFVQNTSGKHMHVRL